MEEHDSLDDDLENIQQPDRFDLELELVRWVKIAASKTIPPVMCKPAGPITQHYGLDSKSRWREAVCVMMLEADPHLETEGTNKLGRQLAQLFRQDLQLWEVKARQLHNWVKRGLTNVKLLDRTLAYFQNQSSWLQYIKNLKNPIPMIESPGFPGTQWSEHYWKEQTVMLLMQESEFPQGTDPVFCSRLFREEPGKWKLKMEQFKSWLERGKTDPLPEYFGTGKNCPECGLFLWDTRSFLKHMKRNHGINDREKSNSGRESPDGAASPPLLFISDKRSKSPSREENTDESSAAETADEKNGANGAESADPDDKFPATSDSEPSTSQATSSRHSTPNRLPSTPGTAARGSSLPSRGATKASSTPSGGSRASAPARSSSKAAAKQDKQVEGDVGTDENSGSGEDSGPSLLSLTLPSRSAATKREERLSGGNPTVFCPECNYKTTHSKIVDHLLKCKKALAANKPDKPPLTSRSGRILQSPGASAAAASASASRPTAGGSGGQSAGRSGVSPVRATSPKLVAAESSSAVPSSSRAKETVSASSTSSSSKPKSSPFQKTNNIVKKVFWKKFESERQQQNNSNNNSRDSPEPYKSPDSSSYRSPEQARSPDQYKPPLKLKLSRKEGSTDSSYFEINKPIISSLLRQNMNRFSPTASRGGGGGHSPISDRSPSHPRSPVPSSPSYRSPVRSPTPTGQGTAETRSPAHYTAISSTVTSPRTQPLPTTPSPVDLSMKPHDDSKLPPPVKVIIKKYEFPKENKDKSTPAVVKHETDNAPIKDESQTEDNKETDVDMKEEGGDDPKKSGGGLRGGRGRAVFTCPLCTTEFAILSNLEKHIDKDHKDIEKPTRKRRSVTMKKSSSDFSSLSSSPPKRSRKSTGDGSKLDDSSTVSDTNSSVDTSMDTSTDADNRKLTEYEIFQSLQLKTKNERRKMTCTECGLQIPPNNMKRHMERHNKEEDGEDSSQTQDVKKKNSGMESCKECGKEMKKNMIKRHMAKHKREDAAVDPPAAVGSSTSAGSPAGTDDRIPCKECGKRLPKNAMKRHLMKHEADNFMPSTGKSSLSATEDNVKVEPGDMGTASAQSHDEEEKDIYSKSLSLQRSASPSQKQTEVKSKAERKKITCDICGLTCAPNTYKRHMDRHKREDENPGEVFAPIEITPTKDYWEMNDIKPNLEKVKSNLTTSSSSSSSVAPAPIITNPLLVLATKQGRTSSRRTSTTEQQRSESPAVPPPPPVKPVKTTSSLREVRKKDLLARKEAENNANKDFSLDNVKVKLEDESDSKGETNYNKKETSINNSIKLTDKQQDINSKKNAKRSTSSPSNSEDSLAAKSDENGSTDSNTTNAAEKKEVQEQEKGKVSGSDEEGEGPLEQAVRKVVSYKMTPKQALQIYNLTPKVLFDYLLGETDEDRMAILKKVNLKSADEDRVIQFCTENEDHLSYKSVISFVKDLKHKDGDEDFTLSRLEAYRWWYAFRKKFDLKITAKKK